MGRRSGLAGVIAAKKYHAMSKIYFVTGTDTGVGKTLIAAALIAGLCHRGRRARYIKPMQTGLIDASSDDTGWIVNKTGIDSSAVISPLHRFKLPAAPELAARREGVKISFERIVREVSRHAADVDILIVEGAGGLLVPIDTHHTMLDLMIALSASPVVVARSALGTLNHTALTWREMIRVDLKPAGLIINDVTPASDDSDKDVRTDNIQQLTRMVAPAPAIHIEHAPSINRDLIIRIASRIIHIVEDSHV